MIFICYPKCSTCKKAQAWLDSKGITYTLRNIKEENPKMQELSLWHKRSKKDLRKLFNTSGLLYRSMNLKEKLSTMSEEDMLSLLSSDGMLVKRPLLVTDDNVLIGFKESEWEDTLIK